MKLILLPMIAACALLASCHNQAEELNSTYVFGHIDFLIQDVNNQNLLEPTASTMYNYTDFRIYSPNEKNQMTLYYNELMDAQYGFMAIPSVAEQGCAVRVFPQGGTKNNGSMINYIRWTEQDTDTLEVVFVSELNFSRIDRVIINGTELWSSKGGSDLNEQGKPAFFRKVVSGNKSTITVF